MWYYPSSVLNVAIAWILFFLFRMWLSHIINPMTFALLQKNMNCFPAVNYMFKVNNRNTRSERCLKLTIKIPERRLTILYALKTPENLSKRTQTSLRRLQDFLKRSRRLTTKQDVVMTSGKRCRIYDVLKTSDLWRLADVWYLTSWRRL